MAAFAVVLHHLWLLGAWRPDAPWQWWLLRFTPLNVVPEGRAPVILFFVLSGFVLTRALVGAPTGYGAFLLRRFARIYLPFAAAIVLSASFYAWLDPPDPRPFSPWFGGLWRHGFDLGTVLGHLLMPGTHRDDLDPVVWSLVHELRISALMPALVWAARRRLGSLLAATAAAEFAIVRFSGVVGIRPFWGAGLGGSLLVSCYFVPFFVVGVGLALRAEAVAHWGARMPMRTALGVLAIGVALLSGAAGANDFSYGAGAAVVLALALGPSLAPSLTVRPLLFLGRISYSLYLVHLPMFLFAIYGFEVLHGVGPPRALVPALVPAAIVAGALFHRLVERPSQRLGAALTGSGSGRSDQRPAADSSRARARA